MEIEYADRKPSADEISKIFSEAGIQSVRVQHIGDSGVLFRFREINETEHQMLLTRLEKVVGEGRQFSEKRFESVGPLIGTELKQTSVKAIILVLFSILLYTAWAFRKVSEPVSSWKYGIATILALLHDVIIPLGLFAWLGHAKGVEIDLLFITGVLTILGFSVHDTIVVFDRIREKLQVTKGKKPFTEVIDESVNETFARSINTSLTAVIVLCAVFLFGGDSTRYFSLLLIVGIVSGTYSSIFVASPLLVSLQKWHVKIK